MHINEKIKNIITEIAKTDLDEQETEHVINRMLNLGKWEEIRDALINILYENDKTVWGETIVYIYYFQNRGFKYEDAKTIAILYNCLSLSDDIDENLVWTITIYIKAVSYLSEYEPYKDEAVLSEMARIDLMRKNI